MSLKKYHKLLLSLLSGLLMSLGYTQLGLGWTMLIAFVPILMIWDANVREDKKRKGNYVFLWSFLSFVVWNIISTFWVYYASPAGVVLAVLLSAVLMSFSIWLASIVMNQFGKKLGYVAFISIWMSYEYLFMNSQLSWPWLVLGNAFANNVAWIQWYEFTGHMGGTLWILLVNVLLYEFIKTIVYKQNESIPKSKIIALLAVFLIPLSFSLIRYYTYTEGDKMIDVLVFQPNVDPYNDKYNISDMDQLRDMFTLVDSLMDKDVDFIVGPETAIPNGMWLGDMTGERTIDYIHKYLSNYPSTACVIGAVTRKYYPYGKDKTETSKPFGKTGDYYDLYNSALYIDTTMDIQSYHKSRLVPGVEAMPYPKLFGFIGELVVDLGGIRGRLGYQDERTPLVRYRDSLMLGSVICYESIYGEFFSEFVRNGAQFMTVITNDGWWHDTPGYRQH